MNFFDAPTKFRVSRGLIAIADSLRASAAELDVACWFPVGKRPVCTLQMLKRFAACASSGIPPCSPCLCPCADIRPAARRPVERRRNGGRGPRHQSHLSRSKPQTRRSVDCTAPRPRFLGLRPPRRASEDGRERAVAPPPNSPTPPPPTPRGSSPTRQDTPRFRPSRRWILFALALLAFNFYVGPRMTQPPSRVRVPYSPFFLNHVRDGNVEEITSKGPAIQGTFKHKVKFEAAKPTARIAT